MIICAFFRCNFTEFWVINTTHIFSQHCQKKMPTFMTFSVIPLHQSHSQAARILSSLLKCPFFYSRFLSFCNLPRGPSHIRYWRHIGLQLSFSDTGRSHFHPKHVGMFAPPTLFPQSLILSSSSSLWLSLKASLSKSPRFIWGIIFNKSKFGFDPPRGTVRRFPWLWEELLVNLMPFFRTQMPSN